MNRGRWSLAVFAALALFSCFAVGTWKAVAELPGIFTPPPDIHEGNDGLTWLGHGAEVSYALGFALLVIIYVGKRWISLYAASFPAAVGWYCLGIASSLPYIWFLVELDWQNPFVYRVSCWFYDPIAVWAVPTASFAWDVGKRTPCTGAVYFIRSVVEIVVVVPIWFICWIYISFFVPGGSWI